MTSLIKINYTISTVDINNLYVHSFIKHWINKNKNKFGLITLDYRNRIIYSHNIKNKLIPFKFIDNIIFKYIHTFQQNNKLIARQIRKTVSKLVSKLVLKNKNILCFGGESYVYPLINNNNFTYYTNSKYLAKEALFNSKIYNIKCNIIYKQYNQLYNKHIITTNVIIINLSKLYVNLMKLINVSNTKNIIIINCHHKDFWKKIKYLSNYTLCNRYKFIAHNYFVTVNLFNKKNLC